MICYIFTFIATLLVKNADNNTNGNHFATFATLSESAINNYVID